MRTGYILLHRQGLTLDEWKHPARTLAWIDFCTMAAWEEFTAHDGVVIKRGEVVASYGFLATRWRKSKGRVHEWMKYWVAERQVERQPERCAERNAERFFIVNYAKYQDLPEREAERLPERSPERQPEPMKGKQVNQNTQITDVRVETEVLYETIAALCKKHGVTNAVSPKALDILVDRYVGKVRMKVEIQHCFSWLVDKGFTDINTSRIGNWFKKSQEIQKREQLRQLERKEADMNPAMAERRKKFRKESTPATKQSISDFLAAQHES